MQNVDGKRMPTTRKIAGGQVTAYDTTIQKITQRTRNLRKSLHKIQKQFDNHAITKFFQRSLKAQSHPRYGEGDDGCVGGGSNSGDSGNDNNSASNDNDDENESDAFAAEQLSDLCGNNDAMITSTVENGILPNDAQTVPNHLFFAMNGNDDDDVELTDQSCYATTAPATLHGVAPSTNIFLQKPVLHLNIDATTLMQAKSVVINKHLDACPNFATSFPAFINASVQSNCSSSSSNNNNNNHSTTANTKRQSNNNNDNNKSSEDESSAESSESQTVHGVGGERCVGGKLKGHKQKCDKQKLRKRRPRKCANKWSDRRQNDAIDSDSNSCDSGVVSDRSFEVSSTDSNKPTTPHRIVCPSTTNSPTSEESPKFPPPASLSNIKCRRIGAGLKQTAHAKRTRGKSVQKR